MSLLSTDLDSMISDLQKVDPLGTSPAAVSCHKNGSLAVDDASGQGIGTEI